MVKFTVFTPTYNRAHTLDRVFDSLHGQTMDDFEWLVVDNGSTDNTEEIVKDWAQKAKFPIRYTTELRRGKHFCHNDAIQLAKGELFLVADSDDSFVYNALEVFDRQWQNFVSSKPYCCGASCLSMDLNGNQIGTTYSFAERYSTLTERIYIHKLRGEHWGFMRTDIVRQYPFPEIDGFVPEGLVWLQIARDGYFDYCCNDALRIYWGDQPDSLSKRQGYTRGEMLYAREMLIRDWAFIRRAPMRFARAGLLTLASPFLLPVTR